MNIDITLDQDFQIILQNLNKVYGDDLASLNGLSNKALNHSYFINNFIDNVVNVLANASPADIDYTAMQVELCSVDEHDNPTNIGVQAYYNQNHVFQYFTDKFLDYLAGEEFSALTTDEAQRIKLVTYYTFNSIPLQENWKVLISYRIYAN